MSRPAVTGIILAGGESRRMGRLKPLVVYRGKPMISWILDAFQPLCEEIIIIANSGDFSEFTATVHPDRYPGNGPAGGIESGLFHARNPVTLIASCDTPNLTTPLFSHLLAHHAGFDISIAGHDGNDEPLIGVFNRAVQPLFQQAIIDGDPHPPRIIRRCHWQEVPVSATQPFYHPDLFLNLNAPSDLIR